MQNVRHAIPQSDDDGMGHRNLGERLQKIINNLIQILFH